MLFAVATWFAMSAVSPTPSDVVVLRTIPSHIPDAVFEIVAKPCKGEERRIATRFVKSGKVVIDAGEVESEWAPGCEISRSEKDSSGSAWEWELGIENSNCSFMAQPVRLASDLTAALVSLQCGFEHLHRLHELLGLVNGKLARIWVGRDYGGPSWSLVHVVPMPAGRDNILFTSVLSFIGGEQEDLFDVTRVQWDEKGLNMKTQPEPLFMVIHGTVKDIANGRTLQSTITAPEKCRELGVFVLKASEYPKLKPNGFVVAQPTPSESESPKLLNQAKSCGAPPDSYVKRAR